MRFALKAMKGGMLVLWAPAWILTMLLVVYEPVAYYVGQVLVVAAVVLPLFAFMCFFRTILTWAGAEEFLNSDRCEQLGVLLGCAATTAAASAAFGPTAGWFTGLIYGLIGWPVLIDLMLGHPRPKG